MTGYVLALDDAAVQRFLLAGRLAEGAERTKWAAVGIAPGARVADIGCGPGAIATLLASLVAPGGTVLGIDSDRTALAAASQLAKAAGVANVEFREGNAASTGLPRASLDVVMVRHVLGHNGGRETDIVSHLVSLLRPGGSLYLVDVDLTGLRIYPQDPDLTDMYRRYFDFHAGLGNDISAGLRLPDLIRQAGLELTDFDGRYDRFREKGFRGPPWEARAALAAAGLAGPEDLARWAKAFERLDREQEPPSLFLPVFIATGRRGRAQASADMA
ncbi:MAG TPA: methyltransferase domain-containing protein [Streptosporangiaceae bacterium]